MSEWKVPRPIWPRSLHNRLVAKPHLTLRNGRWQCWYWGECFEGPLPGFAYDRALAARRISIEAARRDAGRTPRTPR